MAVIKGKNGQDNLVFTSSSGYLSIVSFDSALHKFVPLVQRQISQPGFHRRQLGAKLAISPE